MPVRTYPYGDGPNLEKTQEEIRDLLGGQQLGVTASSDVLDIGAAADLSKQLPAGTYRISGSADCWYKQGGSSVVAVSQAVGTAFLAAGAIDTISVDDTDANGYLSVIYDSTGTDTGKLSVTKQ